MSIFLSRLRVVASTLLQSAAQGPKQHQTADC